MMKNETENDEFWESSFIEKQEMWGFEPAKSAILAKNFFFEKSVKNVLVPGIGYGRNAQIFIDHGMDVTGIEISKTAIEMARKFDQAGLFELTEIEENQPFFLVKCKKRT